MGWCYCVFGGVCRNPACVLNARCLWGGGLRNGVFCYMMSGSGINGMRDKIKIHMNGTGLSFFLSFFFLKGVGSIYLEVAGMSSEDF